MTLVNTNVLLDIATNDARSLYQLDARLSAARLSSMW